MNRKGKMNPDIEKLREITENLPPLPVIHKNGKVEVDMEAGDSVATGVMAIPGVAVADVVMTPGSMTPMHTHPEREWFIVYDGDLVVIAYECEKGSHYKAVKAEYELGVGDYFFVEADSKHSVGSRKGARLIAISVPRSEVFPNVRRKD